MGTNDSRDTFRQPEYTGENRCTPCTIVNVAIAAIFAALVTPLSVPLGVITFAAFVGVIYLRGYLVPGTPTLTKRYVPDRMLAWFDKAPAVDVELGERVDLDDDLDPETTLLEAGALETCEGGTDLCLTPAFTELLYDHVERLREDEGLRLALGDLVGADEARVELAERGTAFVADLDDEQVGRWPSRAALIADLAADGALRELTRDWTDLPLDRRSGVLGSLRVFVERCPECTGPVRFREETAESCCRSWQVLASECENCGARLFEMKASEVEAAEG